jgi:uncharacterized membrane protein
MKCRLNPKFKTFIFNVLKFTIGGPIALILGITALCLVAYLLGTTVVMVGPDFLLEMLADGGNSPAGAFINIGFGLLFLFVMLPLLLFVILLIMADVTRDAYRNRKWEVSSELEEYDIPFYKVVWYSIVTCEKK